MVIGLCYLRVDSTLRSDKAASKRGFNMPGPSNQAMNWSFVITSASQEIKDRERRKIVRANAMRDYWRRKKLASKDLAKTTGNNHIDKDGGRPTGPIGSLVEDDPDSATRGEPGEPSGSAGTQHLVLEHQTNTSNRTRHIRNKDASPAAPHGDTNAVDPTHMRDPDQARRCNHTSLQKTFVPGPSEVVGNGVIDPFDALPIAGSQHCYVLRNRKILHTEPVLYVRCE